MMYRCKYLNRATGDVYYRTVYGNDEPEANKTALRYEKKGYILATKEQTYDKYA